MNRSQSGQALPLGMALLMLGVLGALVLYNTGQSATTKARLANTADAAAYSGLQWQARALNFAGYTNRAMVANQVSLAQAVTLSSWSTYGMIMSENIARVLSGIPIVNAIATGVETIMVTINKVIDPVAQAMLSVINGVNRGVALAQEAMYQSSYLATPEIVGAVVEQSDPSFSANTAYSQLGVVDNVISWRGFAERVGNSDDDRVKMRERADIVRDSRDPFTRARDWSFFNGFLYIGPGIKVDIKKEGETRLIESEGDKGLEWEWKAKDTLAFHTKVWVPFRGWRGVEVPIGYGSAIANTVNDTTLEEGACDARREWRRCKTWARHNEDTERFTDINVPSLDGSDSRIQMDGYSGLNSFRRLSERSIGKAFPTIKLRIEVQTEANTIISSNEQVAPGLFETPTQLPGGAMSSISIAETYFKPPDVDHRSEQGKTLEFANLYSPWWDVRLAPVSDAERLAAYTLRAGADGLSALPGVLPTNSGDSAATGTDPDSTTLANGSLTAAVGDSLSDAARDFFGDLTEDAEQAIQDALVDAIETAVSDILNGIVSSASGGAVSADDLRGWAEDIAGDADSDEIANTMDTAVLEVEALQVEFQRLDAVVNAEFPVIVDRYLIDYQANTALVRDRLSASLGRPIGLFEHLSGTHYNSGQRDDVQILNAARNRLVADLAIEYRDLINRSTDRFEMNFAMARDFIVAALAAYDSANGQVDWSVFGGDPVDASMASGTEPQDTTSTEDDTDV